MGLRVFLGEGTFSVLGQFIVLGCVYVWYICFLSRKMSFDKTEGDETHLHRYSLFFF